MRHHSEVLAPYNHGQLADLLGVLRMTQYLLNDPAAEPGLTPRVVEGPWFLIETRLIEQLDATIATAARLLSTCRPPGEVPDDTWCRWVLSVQKLDLISNSPLGHSGNFHSAIGMFAVPDVRGARTTATGSRQVVVHAPRWALRSSGGDVTCLGELDSEDGAHEPASVTFDIYDRALVAKAAMRRHNPGLDDRQAMETAIQIALPAA